MIEEVIFKLERIIEEYVIVNDINSIDELLLIQSINEIVFDNCNYKYNLKYHDKYHFNKVDKLVSDFLKSINYEYYLYYQLRKKDNTIKFDYHHQEDIIAYSVFDYDTKERKIYIPMSNTLEDAFCIVHELNHDKNLDEECSNITRSIFTESLSILTELLFEDYLKKNKVKEAKICNNLTLNTVKIKALYNDFCLKLITFYIDKGNINFNDFSNIVIDYNNNQRRDLNYVIDNILEEDIIDIDYENRYVFGILISTYMYDRIKLKKNNINELFELNDMLKKYSVEQVLDYLDLDYNEDYLEPSSYQKLEKCYHKYLKSR